jgi:hypothetical protein
MQARRLYGAIVADRKRAAGSPFKGRTGRISRETHARSCERLEVQFPAYSA